MDKLNWVWCLMPLVPTLGRQRQDDYYFNPGCTVKSCLKKPKEKEKNHKFIHIVLENQNL
jgi:hypothetical protein